jgi:hypothetical protein
MNTAKPFFITVDTEGDNLWSRPKTITTQNARFLPRFQALCEKFGLLPTYLANFEMVVDPAFQEFALDVRRRGTGEIGMHLHAWNSPPLLPLTEDDMYHRPYLMEYPSDVIRKKVQYLTRLMQDTFQCPMRSHRSGRWALNSVYVQTLIDEGYTVDCSVTPYCSWRSQLGDPKGRGGSDYTAFPSTPYKMQAAKLDQPMASGLWEVPMTVIRPFTPKNFLKQAMRIGRKLGVPMRERPYDVLWFRPNGHNREAMLKVVHHELSSLSHLEFMIHSSEFMPGGSPYYASQSAVDSLFRDLEEVFSAVSNVCRPQCLGLFPPETGPLDNEGTITTAK